ncbi:MAG: helix-turn-helix domain-containing protein [Tepidisphaeraceae bacterium]
MKKKSPAKRTAASDEVAEQVHSSSGNVFADIGLPNADEHLAKARLARTICDLINEAGLTQKEAAKRLGIDQPKVSSLVRGKLRDFSTERLMRFVTALDHDVIITIRQPQDTAHPSVRVLVGA